MKTFSTRQAAKKLRLAHSTLNNYIANGKVPAPKSVTTSTTTVHIWSEEEIESVRKLLPKIANGRKTRYQKQRKQQTKRKSKL
jgi:predicted DNA-binding transcriptional regulator AlpA